MLRRVLGIMAAVLAVGLVPGCGTGSDAATGSLSKEDWRRIQLTDTEGRSFRVEDFVGRPVFVENMATWCANCLSQLRITQAAARTMGERAVFVVLSIETGDDPAQLAAYAQQNGLGDLRFAVMTPAMVSAMTARFGTTSVVPPSRPKIVVDAAGRSATFSTGELSAEQITTKLANAA